MGRHIRLCVLALAVTVWSAGLAAQALRVTIEVKPGDAGPKTVEPGRGGMLPVAILTTAAFDAATADPDSIRVGATGTELSVFRSMLEDVDRDNDVDRLLLVRVSETGIKCGQTEVRLTGKTTTGRNIEGSQKVTTEGC